MLAVLPLLWDVEGVVAGGEGRSGSEVAFALEAGQSSEGSA